MNYKFILLLSIITSLTLQGQEQKTVFSLDEAINYALENSYAIKNANNDVEAAKKKVWETTTIGLPQVNAKFDYQNFLKQPVSLLPAAAFDNTEAIIETVEDYFDLTPNSTPTPVEGFIPVTFGTKQNLNANVTLNQLLFDGSYLVGLQSAKTFLKISESAKEKTAFAIKDALINAYTNVLLTEESIQIFEKNKALLEKNLRETREIVKNGFAEEQNAEQLEITLASVKNQLNKIKRLKETTYKLLKIAMGIEVDQVISLTDNMDDLLLKNMDLGLTKQLFNVENHIDYKIALNNKKSNELLVKYEQSKALPSLSAFLNYGKSANNNSFNFFNSDQTWFSSSILGVSLNVPIFSSLKRSAKTQQAKINLEKAKTQLTETAQQLKLNLQKAQSDYQFSLDQYETSKQSLALAERIEKKENIKYFEGISSSFDLTNAQNQLYTKQQEYLQSIFEIITSKSKLENALNIK